jgi:hypothetical protein
MENLKKYLPDFRRAYSMFKMRRINHKLFLKQPAAAGRLIPDKAMDHCFFSGWYLPLLSK